MFIHPFNIIEHLPTDGAFQRCVQVYPSDMRAEGLSVGVLYKAPRAPIAALSILFKHDRPVNWWNASVIVTTLP